MLAYPAGKPRVMCSQADSVVHRLYTTGHIAMQRRPELIPMRVLCQPNSHSLHISSRYRQGRNRGNNHLADMRGVGNFQFNFFGTCFGGSRGLLSIVNCREARHRDASPVWQERLPRFPGGIAHQRISGSSRYVFLQMSHQREFGGHRQRRFFRGRIDTFSSSISSGICRQILPASVLTSARLFSGSPFHPDALDDR